MILLGLDDGVHSLRLVEHNDPHRLAIGFVRFHPHLLQYKVIFFKATGMYNQCGAGATLLTSWNWSRVKMERLHNTVYNK